MPRINPSKPATQNADLANLPAALRARTQEKRWVVWAWRWNGKKWDKPPLQACNSNRFAKSDDPATWANYTDALAEVTAGRADGIGYMLAGSDLNAIDLDHCRDPITGVIETWAQTEIDTANSYTEVTVSGTGLRILGIGSGAELHRKFQIAGTTNGAAIELYRCTNRFITVSGAEISDSAELINTDAVLDNIVVRYDKPIKPANSSPITDAAIDNLIKHGAPLGQRSEAFAKVVWTLAMHGHSPEKIKERLARHPGGIASKYIDRLDQEVERCYRKWEIKNPKRVTQDGESDSKDSEDGEF
jgi:putative DNA primase/helicase